MKKTAAPAPKSAVPAFAAATKSTLNDVDDTVDPSQQDVMPIDGPEPTGLPTNSEEHAGKDEELQGRVQILDFHTANPIISYQNQIFSCEWTSTLGTDVLLTTPDAEFQHPILREFASVSILAATSIKLSGRPIQLTSRPGTNAEETESQEQTPAPESSKQASFAPAPDQLTQVKIPVGKTPTPARQNQASFLERLIAVKAAKGETDQVTVYTQKTNQGSGWRSQHKALEEEHRASQDGHSMVGTSPARSRGAGRGRPGRTRKGAWKTRGPKTQKGGLFRDYRPQLWDTNGADIRGPSATPESWDQLQGEHRRRRVSFADNAGSSITTTGFRPRQFGSTRGTPVVVEASASVDSERPPSAHVAAESIVQDEGAEEHVAADDSSPRTSAGDDIEMPDA